MLWSWYARWILGALDEVEREETTSEHIAAVLCDAAQRELLEDGAADRRELSGVGKVAVSCTGDHQCL